MPPLGSIEFVPPAVPETEADIKLRELQAEATRLAFAVAESQLRQSQQGPDFRSYTASYPTPDTDNGDLTRAWLAGELKYTPEGAVDGGFLQLRTDTAVLVDGRLVTTASSEMHHVSFIRTPDGSTMSVTKRDSFFGFNTPQRTAFISNVVDTLKQIEDQASGKSQKLLVK